MSELGPTRTYSDIGGTDSGHVRNVSARKRLRELLDDEPKVKWIEENPGVTYWSDGTHAFIAEEYGDGKLEVKTLMTPEQAIAATVGDTDATATRHGDADVVTCVPDDYTTKLMAEVERLQGENAKLRELVQDIWDWLAPTAISSATPLKGLHDRMCELGIGGRMSKAIDEMRAYFNQPPVPPAGALLEHRKKVNRWLDEAEAENARLLKELEAEHVLAEQLGHYHEDAKAENAKLRKLVRGLDYCSDELNFAECDKCPLHDSDPNLEPKCVRMMEELGIETRGMEIEGYE